MYEPAAQALAQKVAAAEAAARVEMAGAISVLKLRHAAELTETRARIAALEADPANKQHVPFRNAAVPQKRYGKRSKRF